MQYAVVIDAGSSGSRVHVYSHTRDAGSRFPTVDLPDLQMKIQPGLSAYAPTGEGAGESLWPLVEFAKQYVGRTRC